MNMRILICSAASLIALGVLGCQIDDSLEENGGSAGGVTDGGGQGGEGGGTNLCEGRVIPPAADEAQVAEPFNCSVEGCPEGFECVDVERMWCPPQEERCECDPRTGEVSCQRLAIGAPCMTVMSLECQEAEVPPGGIEPPVAGDDQPPPSGAEPPPGGEMVMGCLEPNPAESCLSTGCPEGLRCVPSDSDECAPSSCSCDEELGEWLCTRDCGPVFTCAPPSCLDADRDGICDTEDSVCESDQSLLECRRVAPDCPRGTVPEVVAGCYNDACVSWEECARRTPPPPPPEEPMICGGFTPNPSRCPDGTFCYYAPLAMCGAADAPGVCTPLNPDALCPELFAPICGCDGQTYANECEAMRQGTSVASRGECEALPPGGPGEACGSRGLPECGPELICFYPLEAMCGNGDIPGTCEPPAPADTSCTAEFLPVCGCDGETYSNRCNARTAGASVAYEGACQELRIQCGGIAGLACPRGMSCEDDPYDDCDPNNGGADCIGVCVGP